MLWSVIRAPTAFFDANPVGRIISRFTKDTEIVDKTLCMSLIISDMVGPLNVIIPPTDFYSPSNELYCGFCGQPVQRGSNFLFRALHGTCIGITVQVAIRRYSTSGIIYSKRLAATSRTHITSHFATVFDGMTSIRVTQKQNYFNGLMHGLNDQHGSETITNLGAKAWGNLYLGFIVGLMILSCTTLVFGFNDQSVEKFVPPCVTFGATMLHVFANFISA